MFRVNYDMQCMPMTLFWLADNCKLKSTLRNCRQNLYALTHPVTLVSRKARTEEAKIV